MTGSGLVQPTDLDYQVRLLDGAAPSVQITVRLAGSSSGLTTLSLSDDTKADGLEVRIGQVTASAEDAVLAVARGPGSRWSITHQPGQQLIVGYRLNPGSRPPRASNYEPMLTPHFCALFSASALLYPDHLRGDLHPALRMAFRWVGFHEAGWRSASSYGQATALRFEDTPWSFERAVFLAVPALSLGRCDRPGQTLWLAGADWMFSPDLLADRIANLLAAARLFDDLGPTSLLIGVLPVGSRDEGGGAYSGTCLANALLLLLPPPWRLDRFDDALTTLLAHETAHLWIGQTIRSHQTSGAVAWFMEEFATHVARRLCERIGQMPPECGGGSTARRPGALPARGGPPRL
jgi:hypothetical protein